MKEISVDDVAKKLENNEKLNLIDVREDDEVAEGMIPTAKHLPLGKVPEHVDEFDPSKEYIVVCHAGGRSKRAQEYLVDKGINAVNLTGGMVAWENRTN